jgi:DNA (cytosine-5)-methyltransferase 1
MRVVSLFAGIGGFDLGFERAGAKTVATVEIDQNCRKLLAEKWPDAVHLDDVRTAGRRNLPDCDVITFGFPCQDLSVAGKRAGLEGKRSGLFYEAMRIVDELQPAWAIWENVPGLLSSDNGRDLARVLFRLGESGYFGCVRCIDAQWLGVAQRRRRLFGVFTRLDSGADRAAEVLSVAESLRGHPAPSREARQVAPTIPARSTAGGGLGTDFDCDGGVISIQGNLIGRDAGGPVGVGVGVGGPMFTLTKADVHGVAHTLRGEGFDASEDGTGRSTPLGPVAMINMQGSKGNAVAQADGPSFTLEARNKVQAVAICDVIHGDKSCNGKGWNDDGSAYTLDTMATQGVAVPEIAGTLKACGGKSGGWSNSADHAAAGYMVPEIAGCITSRDAKSHNPDGSTKGHLVPVAFRAGNSAKARSLGETDNLSPTLPSEAGGNKVCVAQVQWASGGGKVYNPTTQALRSGAEHNYQFAQVGMRVRRLTPTECERLQGFPDGWTDGFADSTRYRMLGNAVCVNVAEWIAKRLVPQNTEKRDRIQV